MKAFKPYVAVDIETTGLAPSSRVLQVAAVLDNGHPDLQALDCINMTIKLDGLAHVEHYALAMNADILKKALTEGLARNVAIGKWNEWMRNIQAAYFGGKRMTLAGKNAAGFDIPILKDNGFEMEYFTHRVLDVGPLYFPDFGYVPNLGEINQLLGRGDHVAHTAYEDCLDVIKAIRAKMS